MKTTSYVLLAFLFLFQFSHAEEKIQLEVMQTDLTSAAGKSVEVAVQVHLPKGFHLYADQLKLKNINPSNYQIGQIKISPQTEFYDKHTQTNRSGFSDTGKILFQIESPENISVDTQNVQFDLRYQVCTEQVCYLPKTENFNLKLVYKKSVAAATEKKSAAVVTENKLDLFSNLEAEFSKNIYWSFLLVFLAGILTSFTPCIFPMIPITMSVLGHDPEKNTRLENFLKSLLYVLGIAVTYSTLGVLAALTGTLFGNALSNKYVLSGIVLLFVVMAFGMWGFYDLQVPAFIRNKFGESRKSKGYLGIFVIGIFAGVVASPCVGPVLVSILSYVSTTKNALLGFGLLFTYALGLGLIFIVIGLFSHFLKLLPKSGAWMNSVKFVMGFLMICMAVYYFNFIVPVFKYLSFNKTGIENSEGKNTNVIWAPYSEKALETALKNNRPVMIDFFAEWCGACHELQDKTFSQAEFKQISEQFDLLTVDATDDKPEIQRILTKYDVKGLPTVVFVNKKGTVLNTLTFTQFLEWSELKPKMQKALE